MTDDPTTTGTPTLPPQLPPGMVAVMRRDVKLELEGRFEVAIYGGRVFAVFFYGVPEHAAEMSLPLDMFESEEEAARWAFETAEAFRLGWGDVMGYETARHLHNLGRFTLFQMGRSRRSLEEIIAEQVKQLEKSMREWFHLPVGRGNFSKWQGHELAASLVTLLARHPAYTWDELSAALKELDPGRAPKSGDALRQLARRHGLLLRALKRDAAKRREPEDAKPGKRRAAKRRVKA